MARIRGEFWQAQRGYTEAIAESAREGFIQVCALANERRARFARVHQEPGVAGLYLRAARDGYLAWGATTKVRVLEEANTDLLEAHEFDGAPATRQFAIDSLGLIKASQAISAETVPSRLFERILRIAIEVAGAQKGVLLLGESAALKVRARVTADDGVTRMVDEVPLTDAQELPGAIVRYVARLKEPLVLTDASHDGAFATDAHVQALGVRSVACVPLTKQAEVVGLVYLENNAMAGAFTQERMEVVQVLAAQAVISLENSTFIQERDRAEQAARFLASAGASLVESLDYDTTLLRVARLAVPTFADWCFLDAVDDNGTTHRVEACCANPDEAALAERLKQFAAVEIVAHAVLLHDVSERQIRELAHDENHVDAMLAAQCRSLISVPLVARGRTLGMLTFVVAHAGRRYDAADLAVGEELAERCALAMDNANLYKEAQEAVSSRDEFLTIASHELKTPLTPLQLQLHTLERRLPALIANADDASWVKDRIGILRRQGERLNRLVNEMLDLSRVTGGRLLLELDSVDLAALATQVVRRFEEGGEIARTGSQVTVHVDAPAVGQWDPLRLEQVITNLLTNALKFGEGKPVDLTITRNDSSATVLVTDQGIGIGPDHLKRIFGRFERAVSAQQYGGLGMGLYIANQIVEALGGGYSSQVETG